MMILLLFTFVLCCHGSQDTWSHEMVLDGNSAVHLSWVVKDEHVTFDLSVAALGYVAIGFSPNGGMKGSDIMLAWVADNGTVQFYDMYATGNMAPEVDVSQNYDLISGTQNSSHTVVRFRRKLITCDEEHDYDLGDDTVRLIWAYSDEDPQSVESLQWHREARGTKSVFLLSSQHFIPKNHDVDKYKQWDIVSKQVEIPDDQQTFYWCTLVKAPFLETKHHIVGSYPIITKGNEGIVHHMVLYECYHPEGSIFEQYLETGGHECRSENMPLDLWGCISSVIAWGVGSEGDMFTEKAGIPLPPTEDGPKYFFLEIHYDNPMYKNGVIDSSGLRLFYTDELREYDAGTLVVGHEVSPLQMIPPAQQTFTNVGSCMAECTSKGLPEEGIKVLQLFPHAHLAGKAVRVRHIRNKKELPPLMEDNHYDFNYQQSRTITPEVTILPGDEILVECDYTTKTRQNITYGGLGTFDEMCLAYLTIYPAARLAMCFSSPNYKGFEKYIGAEIKDPVKSFLAIQIDHDLSESDIKSSALENIELDSPENMNLNEYLENIKWTPEEANVFEEALVNGPVNPTCITKTLEMIVNKAQEYENPAAVYHQKSKKKKASQCTMGKETKKVYGYKTSNLYQMLKNKHF